MKRIIYKTLFVTVLMLISMSVFAQTYLYTPSGTISVTGSEYSGPMTREWYITTGTNKPLQIDYEVDLANNYDRLDISAIESDGSEFAILTVGGQEYGSISTVLPTGKAKIRFNSDGSGGGGIYYDGFVLSYEADNSGTNYDILSTAILVSGSVGIGTADVGQKGLYVNSPQSQYGIRSISSSTNRNSYGIYSAASSTHTGGYLYGLYSSVSGTASNKWAGYFTGGNVEVSGGVLKANNGVIVAGGNVGIGTTSPAYKLDVAGTSRITGNAVFSGNVGIGTTDPASKLDVRGSVFIPSMSSYWIGSNTNSGNRLRLHHNGDNAYIDYALSLHIRPGANESIVFDPNGNVGLGTSNPTNKLDVNGIIRAKEVKIETGWADFVFNEDYNLRPLSEVNDFIRENRHLPEIPSATEVKENEGVNLGEMQVKLLQKIEELTLYAIQQQEMIDKLSARIEQLEKK